MTEKRNNIDDAGKPPESLKQALMRYIWALRPRSRIIVLVSVGLLVVAFGAWSSLPDSSKQAVLEWIVQSDTTTDEETVSEAPQVAPPSAPQEDSDTETAMEYTVNMLIPSYMSEASVSVNGKSPPIINQLPTAITIRIKEQSTGHRIILKKGDRTCTKELSIHADTTIAFSTCTTAR